MKRLLFLILALAVSGTALAQERLPTAQELNLPELSNVVEWYGVVVPAATPKAILQKLSVDGIFRKSSQYPK